MKRIHLIISGNVQGVGFRYYCHVKAAVLGITGYARNLPDGSVEVEAQGNTKSIEEFVQSVQRGPKLSTVSKIDRSEINVLAYEGAFLVQ